MIFHLLKDVITEIMKCPECESTVHIIDNKSSRMGCSHMFNKSCSCCDWKKLYSKGLEMF